VLEIRQAVPAEANTIADFQIRLAKESEDMALDGPTVARGVEAVFENPALGTYHVAAENGRVIACLLIINEWSDWRNGMVWWIHSLYVVPEARGRGVFRAMYEKLQSLIRQTPALRGLRLYVDKRNTSAQQAYDALGMTAEHYHLYEWLK